MLNSPRAIQIGTKSMTEEQFREWLQHIDQNKDGRISKEELITALKTLGLRCKRLRAWWVMKKNDTDKSGFIDTDSEIRALMEYARKHWGIDIRSK